MHPQRARSVWPVSYTHLDVYKRQHKICAYIYELANAFNGFYHDTKILSEENEELKKSYISLLVLTKEILEACIDMLGFSAPDRM